MFDVLEHFCKRSFAREYFKCKLRDPSKDSSCSHTNVLLLLQIQTFFLHTLNYHNFAVTIQTPYKGIKFYVKAKKILKKLVQRLSASFQHISFLLAIFCFQFLSLAEDWSGAVKVFSFFLYNMLSLMYCFI